MESHRPVGGAGAVLAGALLALIAMPASSAEPVERLGWLAGCWERTDADPGSGEQWTAPAGGTLLGVSRTVRGGRTTGHEFVAIRAGADGVLVYHAHPSGQPAAEFRLLRLEERAVVFENPAHDFPQRVGYRLDSADALTAWIEGTHGGTARRIEFPMRRSACAGAAAPTAS